MGLRLSQTMTVVQLRRGEAGARLFSGPLPADRKARGYSVGNLLIHSRC